MPQRRRGSISALTKFLPAGATVLELGMGPGVDFDLLSQHYQVTGSDNSQVFLDRYREKTRLLIYFCWIPKLSRLAGASLVLPHGSPE